MKPGFRHFVASVLVAAILLVGGVVSAQMVEHGSHHGHHQSAAHTTALCSWLCAAAQGIGTAAVVFESHTTLLALASVPSVTPKRAPVTLASLSRGPPALFL